MKTSHVLASLAMACALLGCGGSSPSEPESSASLSGYARVTGYEQGTLTVKDAAGQSRATTLESGTGTFYFGTVFVPGPYDVYLDKPGKPQRHIAMHGQDSSSPILHAGANNFYWVGFKPR